MGNRRNVSLEEMAKHANNTKNKPRNSSVGVKKEEDSDLLGSSKNRNRSSYEKHRKWKNSNNSSNDDRGNKRFQEFLQAEYGLQIVEMAGDGNCLFRSIAHQLENNPTLHMQYRQRIIKYIISKRKHFELFLEDDEKFDDYIERMKLFGTWGGHHELYAAAQCFRINIEVFQWNAPKYIILYDPTIHDKNINNNSRIPTIQLSFHGDCHFNSVVGDSGPTDKYIFPPIITNIPISNDDSDKSHNSSLVNIVSSAVPWSKSADVIAALRLNNNQMDVAIEYLCTGLSDVVIDENEPIDKEVCIEGLVLEDFPEGQYVKEATIDNVTTVETKQCTSTEPCEDDWTEVVRKPRKNVSAAACKTLSKKVTYI